MKFKIEIETNENENMKNVEQAVHATRHALLSMLSSKAGTISLRKDLNAAVSGALEMRIKLQGEISDGGGNTVGRWEVEEE